MPSITASNDTSKHHSQQVSQPTSSSRALATEMYIHSQEGALHVFNKD